MGSSHGVLEAAARGLPAWVDYPDPPEWLEEFWARYGLQRWGGEATKSSVLQSFEPGWATTPRWTGTCELVRPWCWAARFGGVMC